MNCIKINFKFAICFKFLYVIRLIGNQIKCNENWKPGYKVSIIIDMLNI